MSSAKRFVTIYPSSENVHLTKDVGEVPYVMFRDYGFDATLATFRNEESYPSLQTEVSGLKLDFIPRLNLFPTLSVLFYICRKARKIDILNLYHYSMRTAMYASCYKIFHPSGIVYIKLDCGVQLLSKKGIKKWFLGVFLSVFPNILSCEIEHVKEATIAMFPRLANKLLCIPNGIDDVTIEKMNMPVVSFEQKEKLMITVGNIGVQCKNHPMILNALEKVDLKDWKFAFVGPVMKDFEPVVDGFFQRNPKLQDKVIFTGNISDRKELYTWYNRAKVFCLTSFRDAFPLAVVEALYWGDYLILTPIAAVNDFTNSGNAGKIVTKDADFIEILQAIIDNPATIADNYSQTLLLSQKFRWRKVLSILNDQISKE